MLDIFLMKVFTLLGVVAFLVIWIRYMRLSRMRKSDPRTPAPSRPLALVTVVFDRVFILISLGFALLFLLRGYPDMFLPFSCHLDFPLQLMGMVLLATGVFESWWAIVSFGEFNEPRWAHLKQGHTVVKTGAYRYIRHPQYASKMIAYLGLFLFFKDFLFLLVFLSLVLLTYFQAKSEEKLLIQLFGEEYRSYQATTSMFLPPILSRCVRQVEVIILRKGNKKAEVDFL